MPQLTLDTTNPALITAHVVFITILVNIGKMFPFVYYRRQVTVRERLAISIAMFPRGEVGAGVLVLSIAYGFSGLALTVAFLALTLDLLLTGLYVIAVKKLIGATQ